MWRIYCILLWLGLSSGSFNLTATEFTQSAAELPLAISPPYSLPEQLATAQRQQKQGLVLFFSHDDCALCQYMQTVIFSHATVQAFYQTHFLLLQVPLDDTESVVSFQNQTISAAALAQQFGVSTTDLPTLLFIDPHGRTLYQFQGYTQYPEELIWLGAFILKAAYQTTTFEAYRQQQFQAAQANDIVVNEADNFFDLTFGNLSEELVAAKAAHKQGIVLFFEMENCPFCQRMRQTVFAHPEVQAFYQTYFKRFSIDILSDVAITDFSGKEMTSKAFSQQQNRIRATPVTIFFNLDGEPLYRYSGLIADPRTFIWLGEYVLNGVYETQQFVDFKKQKMQ